MDKDDIEQALYTLVDNFNDRIISKKDFCEIFLDRIHPFRDENGRTCKVLLLMCFNINLAFKRKNGQKYNSQYCKQLLPYVYAEQK